MKRTRIWQRPTPAIESRRERRRAVVPFEGDDRIVRIEGPLEGSREGEMIGLCHRALRSGSRQLALDLSGVSLLTSSGIGVLLLAWREMSRHAGSLVLCGLSPALRVVVELSRLQRVIDVFETRQEALESLEPHEKRRPPWKP